MIRRRCMHNKRFVADYVIISDERSDDISMLHCLYWFCGVFFSFRSFADGSVAFVATIVIDRQRKQ